MSSTKFKISFRNHNVGANSPDGFRVYRKEGSDPCPVVGSDGLHIPDATNLFHEEMGVDLTHNWVDSSEISGVVSYFYRISFFRNNGVNPQKGAVSHERVDTMLLGPINASDAGSLGYPNHFPSNLSGVPYAIDEQPLIHLDPARTVKESAIAHEDEITSSTAVEYSGRGWVDMIPCSAAANAVFDLENILDANGAAVPCYTFNSHLGVAGLATQQTGTAPYEGSAGDYIFCDEGWTVFVLMSPVPNGKAGFSTYNMNVHGTWVPMTSPNASSQFSDFGNIFEWSSQEIKYGSGSGTGLGPDLTSIPAAQTNLIRLGASTGAAINNWLTAYHPAYSTLRNTYQSYPSLWKVASRASASPTGVMGTPPEFAQDPDNHNHFLSHLHLTTCRLSPIIGTTPKYQGWINGGLPGGSVAVDTGNHGGSMLTVPLAPGLAQARVDPYIITMNWVGSTNSRMFAGNGAYAEYLLFPKALSNAQMTTVGSYLNNKYALPNSIETFTGAEG